MYLFGNKKKLSRNHSLDIKCIKINKNRHLENRMYTIFTDYIEERQQKNRDMYNRYIRGYRGIQESVFIARCVFSPLK